MTAYIIASINVTNPDKYKNYMALTPTAIAKYGGKFIVRGGAKEVLEGEWSRPRVVMLQFDSMDAAKRFYHSAEYGEAKDARAGAAEFSMIVVEGIDTLPV